MIKNDPKTTALVMIDLQKGILNVPLAPGSANAVLAAAESWIGWFHALQPTVILTRVRWANSFADALNQPVERPMAQSVLPPEWAELPSELELSDNDVIVQTAQWVTSYGTKLNLQLRRREIRTIVLGGIATDVGVESTARDVWERNYELIFAEGTMAILSRLYASVFDQHNLSHVKSGVCFEYNSQRNW